jgi:phosphate transport system ATP-binding protein
MDPPDAGTAAAAAHEKIAERTHQSAPPADIVRAAKTVETKDVNLYYGNFHAVQNVNMTIRPNRVTALIGSSGCGKTTFLRSINRMHELTPGAWVDGQVVIDNQNIYDDRVDPVNVRRLVGMVFQAPNPFPTMTVAENVAAGLSLNQRKMKKAEKAEVVERSLRGAHLWEEVKDRLGKPGSGLSGGQQQRLCIARAIAVEPEVLLMDEPCSALDPVATLAIEDLIMELKKSYTIAIVTHNMQQAARASDVTAFFNLTETGKPGGLVEIGPTEKIFTNPDQKATEDYVSGRFG